jgi:hypothetical protein
MRRPDGCSGSRAVECDARLFENGVEGGVDVEIAEIGVTVIELEGSHRFERVVEVTDAPRERQRVRADDGVRNRREFVPLRDVVNHVRSGDRRFRVIGVGRGAQLSEPGCPAKLTLPDESTLRVTDWPIVGWRGRGRFGFALRVSAAASLAGR